MTNIWADSYKEIRQPFFETESLEEERAKRDYDGDGKIESGAKEYRGSVHNAIQKKKGGKADGQDTSSVKEEVEEIDEAQVELKQRNKNEMQRKAGNAARTALSSSGTKKAAAMNRMTKLVKAIGRDDEDKRWKRMGEDPRHNPNYRKEEFVDEAVETLAEVDSCGSSADKKIDVMKGGKKNKVVINPPIREEVQEWVDELVSEGYDLSEFTWEEMTKIYESAELEEQMPARGDAETVNATDSTQLSAKRRMAQAQIRADLARVQYQKASMTKESVDSIVEYLSQRSDVFENLEEGVFDPKKSKLKPASERTKRVMTDAQRKAAKKESERVAAIHSKGETVLAGMRSQGKRGKVKTTPDAKPAAPAANRTVKGRYDKLATAANKVLKSAQKDK